MGYGSNGVREMLDAFIIEEIKRRERLRQERDRPVAELPLPSPSSEDERSRRKSDQGEDKPGRGVVIIDLSV